MRVDYPEEAAMRPCGKYWHETEQDADEQVKKMVASATTKERHILNSYFCERCEGWHVGRNHMLRWTELCVGEHK